MAVNAIMTAKYNRQHTTNSFALVIMLFCLNRPWRRTIKSKPTTHINAATERCTTSPREIAKEATANSAIAVSQNPPS